MVGALRPMRTSWPGGKRLGREPGVQEEVPAGTPTFGMGGITVPPSDLCIFWSLQCRYCRESRTWEQRWGKVLAHRNSPPGYSPPRPLTQGRPFYQEPPGGQWCPEVSLLWFLFPATQPWGPRKAHGLLTTPGDRTGTRSPHPCSNPFLSLLFVFLFSF